jgi:2-oxo-4-hydroxy-4-carboxy-5-ureidoimidazoline decarboxylase
VSQTISSLNSCDRTAFVEALGHLFEHSPWVVEETFAQRPFADADALHAALCRTMLNAPTGRQLALVRAHPDLAGRLARAGELTPDSAKEQSAAGLDRLAPEEASEIQRLNEAYKGRFGFPFVICARLNAKDTILASMRKRLGNHPQEELSTALGEIAKIARLRLSEAITSDN